MTVQSISSQPRHSDAENIEIAVHYLMREAKLAGQEDIYNSLHIALNMISEGDSGLISCMSKMFSDPCSMEQYMLFLKKYCTASKASRSEFHVIAEGYEF